MCILLSCVLFIFLGEKRVFITLTLFISVQRLSCVRDELEVSDVLDTDTTDIAGPSSPQEMVITYAILCLPN